MNLQHSISNTGDLMRWCAFCADVSDKPQPFRRRVVDQSYGEVEYLPECLECYVDAEWALLCERACLDGELEFYAWKAQQRRAT